MTNLDLSAAIAAAANELQGGTKSEPQGQPAKKSASKTSATTKSATAKPTAKTDTPKTKGGAKYVIPKEFKQAIEDYLNGRKDMAEKLKQPGKSIDKCCEYIYGRMLKRAQKERGGATEMAYAIPRDEIYGMAVHYYDETDEDLKKEV